ncbi:MAG: hypothetical protein J0H93_08815 [Chlamydiales bacterium]|nr:hypothetical protein [Chlamydiales bacterium]
MMTSYIQRSDLLNQVERAARDLVFFKNYSTGRKPKLKKDPSGNVHLTYSVGDNQSFLGKVFQKTVRTFDHCIHGGASFDTVFPYVKKLQDTTHLLLNSGHILIPDYGYQQPAHRTEFTDLLIKMAKLWEEALPGIKNWQTTYQDQRSSFELIGSFIDDLSVLPQKLKVKAKEIPIPLPLNKANYPPDLTLSYSPPLNDLRSILIDKWEEKPYLADFSYPAYMLFDHTAIFAKRPYPRDKEDFWKMIWSAQARLLVDMTLCLSISDIESLLIHLESDQLSVRKVGFSQMEGPSYTLKKTHFFLSNRLNKSLDVTLIEILSPSLNDLQFILLEVLKTSQEKQIHWKTSPLVGIFSDIQAAGLFFTVLRTLRIINNCEGNPHQHPLHQAFFELIDNLTGIPGISLGKEEFEDAYDLLEKLIAKPSLY